MSDLEIVYHLKDSRSPIKQASIFLITGLVLLVVGLLFSGILGWGIKISAIISLAIGAAQYFNRNTNETILTEDSLISKTSTGEKILLLAEIQKAELNFVQHGKVQRMGLFSLEEFIVDEKTVLVISDGSNKRIEVAAKDFPMQEFSEFKDFLHVFQANGQGNLLQETDRIKALIKENESYLAIDTKMKKDFEQGLLEAYKAAYTQRGDLYLRENTQAVVLYKYDKNPNNIIYFIDNDYLPNLQAEGLETAKMLLAGAEKAIKVVDIRISSYQEIAEKLKKMAAANQSKLQIRKATGKLENLSMKNQMAELNDFDRNELLLQIETVNQLQKITSEMNGLDDMDRAMTLKLQAENLLKS
jgi:hypothetical protein